MENSKVLQFKNKKYQSKSLILTSEEKKKLVDFFTVLIEIDRRENITKIYDKSIKWNSNHTN